ncbi:MAG TPA: alpha-glucuronidase family glycosyl hydrolase [Gammaproteobacteria bacterium]|nr:alpha-glucuronidase family glycosyl hydrolase [Gammaproteobacteria bacterium]
MKRILSTKFCLLLLCLAAAAPCRAEDGYRLWLRYEPVTEKKLLNEYRTLVTAVVIEGDSPTLRAAKREMDEGLRGIFGRETQFTDGIRMSGAVVIGTPRNSKIIRGLGLKQELKRAGKEGFLIESVWINEVRATVIMANTDIGALYGVYHFLRLLQTRQDISSLKILQAPRIRNRLLNHWDNLNRTVERGYAGSSLWDWHKLPDYLYPRYTDYARVNASIGINGASLTNVNANAAVLTGQYLDKFAALAEVFRPYGIRLYLAVRFSSPMEIGGLKTADPLDPQVRKWWRDKTAEIYRRVPDLGGFLVKANSEGQPGPGDYGRTHADGANMLAEALAPHGGLVMWRAFVYSAEDRTDRAKQAYNEFKPLDGKFRKNVLLQVKNGPIDFQPREPFHPLFGAMPKTPLMMELQITKEYTGFATHLVYLGTQYKEILESDTYAQGRGSRVAKVIDGTLHGYAQTGIAGVSNVGADRNWSGSHFDQANWYAFGRLAWDHTLGADAVAEEWIRLTFGNATEVVEPVKQMMLDSWPAAVDYMTPLGLHHIMGAGHHYGPAPWVDDLPRPEWNSVYYHRADTKGIGFDRTRSGSDAVSQYFPPLNAVFNDPAGTPEKFLLWFHHLPWGYKMESGRTLWDELVFRYNRGVDTVRAMRKTWASLEGMIDSERYNDVKSFLAIQEKEAVWWRDACLLYFQTFSRRPLPDQYERPAHDLDYYRKLSFPFAPGRGG